jgi:hypothetical protein
MNNIGIWTGFLLVGSTLAMMPNVLAGDNCSSTNYGVQANTFVIADCSGDTYSYYQYCDQETGAGVGAGSGAVGVGPGSNPESAAAAQGTAGTNCTQDNGGTGSTLAGREPSTS